MGFRRRRGARGERDLVEQYFGDDGGQAGAAAAGRKTEQVCREVWRVLAQIEVDDPRLAGFVVLDVRPAPDVARLAVIVQIAAGLDEGAAREALAGRRGALRAEIAEALQRKRTPELAFEVIAGEVRRDG